MITEQITRHDVDLVLKRVEQSIDPDAANLIRAYLVMLESQIRIYELKKGRDYVREIEPD